MKKVIIMKEPLVSVIMPAYNAGKFIGETIQSVIGQTYTNWELIIVNDASIDCTEDIICEYMKKEERISLYCLPNNSGSSAALNEALCHTKGEYICWLSADDKYKPEMIMSSVKYLQRNLGKDAVFCRHEFINENSEFIEAWNPREEYLYIGREDSDEPYLTMALCGNAFNACSIMAKAEAFKKAGFFNTEYRYANDYDYMLRLLACSNVGYIDQVNVSSRVHDGQVSNEGKNDIEAITVYAETVKNEELRKALFKKAKLSDCRESILLGFKNRLHFYKTIQRNKEVEKVEQMMHEFLETFPKCVEADIYCDEVSSLINESNWKHAIEYLEKIPKDVIDFMDYEKYAILTACIMDYLGDYQGEKKVLVNVLKLYKSNYEAHYMLGIMSERNGNNMEALEHYFYSVKYSDGIVDDNKLMVDNLKSFVSNRL